jgi:hypothetical protein
LVDHQVMRILFDDVVAVAFHLFRVSSGGVLSSDSGRGGQANGLCGAAEPGMLVFTTGRHTGDVPIRLELHDREPPLEPVWQEAVEVSFTPTGSDVVLALWDGPAFPLDLDERDYRVRFCGIGYDNEDDQVIDPSERYLVQLWPSPPAADRVLRQTSDTAAYWHRVAQQTPPPPTVAERAEAQRRERAERERRDEEFRRADEARYWGGRVPDSDRLRQIAPWAVGLAQVDRDLVDEIADAEPLVQRAMAAWAARYTCERAGMAGLDWVAAALDALDRGDPPPPWFADFDAAFARWRGVPRESLSHRAGISLSTEAEPGTPRIDPEITALQAVVTARGNDPLLAAITAIRAAIEVAPGRQAAAITAFRAAFSLPPHPADTS